MRKRRSSCSDWWFPIALLAVGSACAQSPAIELWPDGAPGSEGKRGAEIVRLNEYGEHILSNIHSPSITPYLPSPSRPGSTAVIVIPGGGHAELWMDHEGYRVADLLARHGIAAFVLKYRLAREPGSTYSVEQHALADLQRAIRVVRSRAAEWDIDTQRVGVMGFSAGGELAALASVRYQSGIAAAPDPIERFSSRPDFQALLYPSLPPGLRELSDSPPAYLICGAADQPGISRGLAELYLDLSRRGVPAELHIYAGVGLGFGVRASNRGPIGRWPTQFIEWLGAQGLLRAE